MSLGKNGDLIRRLSRHAEGGLLASESISLLSGYLGRPYPSWDLYPAWELQEGWRNLLTAQHHDIDECEGLCGHIGMHYFEHSLSLSAHIVERTFAAAHLAPPERASLIREGSLFTLSRAGLSARVDAESGRIVSFVSQALGELVEEGREPGILRVADSRSPGGLRVESVEEAWGDSGEPAIRIRYVSET